MIFSERMGKWFMNIYPPFIFNRIKILYFGKDYHSCHVKIKKSLFNRNMNGTIFGGSLFSAQDPFFAILYWQLLERRGMKVQTWLKSAEIQYMRPADQDLFIDFEITEEEILQAEKQLLLHGRYVHTHEVRFKDKSGDVYVLAKNEVYIRLTRARQKPLSGF